MKLGRKGVVCVCVSMCVFMYGCEAGRALLSCVILRMRSRRRRWWASKRKRKKISHKKFSCPGFMKSFLLLLLLSSSFSFYHCSIYVRFFIRYQQHARTHARTGPFFFFDRLQSFCSARSLARSLYTYIHTDQSILDKRYNIYLSIK